MARPATQTTTKSTSAKSNGKTSGTTTSTSGGLVTTTTSTGTVDTSTGTPVTSSSTSTSTSTSTTPTIKVTSTASLASAISSVSTPVTILLAPGTYDVATIYAKSGITLRSASDTSPAVLRGLKISNSANIVVDNVRLGGSGTGLTSRILVYQCNGVTLTRIDIPGVAGTFDAPVYMAILLRLSNNVMLSNFNIGWARVGVSYINVSNVTIQNGRIHDIMVDGMDGGGVNGLTIQGNDISKFHPNGSDHPDGIQIWTTNTTSPSTDIVIRDNLVSRDGLGLTQGIFVTDPTGALPYQRLTVANNVMAGTQYNGIMLSGGVTAKFDSNLVIGYEDMKSWIRVDTAQDTTVESNQANYYVLAAGVGTGGNAVVPQSQAAANQAAAAWRAAHGY